MPIAVMWYVSIYIHGDICYAKKMQSHIVIFHVILLIAYFDIMNYLRFSKILTKVILSRRNPL